MAANYNDIVTKIQSKIASIEGIGHVYPYTRWVKEDGDFKNLFQYIFPPSEQPVEQAIGSLRGWIISRRAMGDEQSAGAANTLRHRFSIIGFMALSDGTATEIIFNKLIDAITAKFRPQDDLDGLVELIQPIQVNLIAERRIYGVLCHYCELGLEVQEYILS